MTAGTVGAGAAPALIETVRRALDLLVPQAENTRYAVAVSGGPDSMVLLDLMAALYPGRVAAATLDHGLRPESAREAAMVARWCADHSIPHALLRPTSASQGNVQAWARAQRYARLEEWRAREGLDWLLTAHHADDQLETMLMRLNRGSGVGGLAAIRARSGRIVRPLLGIRKAALLAHAKAARLPFVEDPSNSDPRFDRASLRARLQDVHWLDPLAATRSAAALGQAEEALDWAARDIADRHIYQIEDGWALDRPPVPAELLRRLVLLLIDRSAPGASPPRGAALDHAIAAAQAGGQASIANWILAGGAIWTLRIAPARRRH
ncbi:MAG: tRNA lysidine(34) synthetase TilS [Sphingobium sp.]